MCTTYIVIVPCTPFHCGTVVLERYKHNNNIIIDIQLCKTLTTIHNVLSRALLIVQHLTVIDRIRVILCTGIYIFTGCINVTIYRCTTVRISKHL
jgi:hypothetical protein